MHMRPVSLPIMATLAIMIAGCPGDATPVDAGSPRDAATEAGETDASLHDGGAFMDASDIGEDAGRLDAGREDAGLRADGGSCAPAGACGVAVPFMPTVFCSEALRACWEACTTAGCFGRCTTMEPSTDCYYCYASRTMSCMVDWCPVEFVAGDCCDSRLCSCDVEDAALDACFERNWAPNCRETYYDSCFAP